MKQENKGTLTKYAVCVGIELLIMFLVIWSDGFFTESVAVNVQILADAFFVAGIAMSMLAGMLFISSEGALIGIGYALRNTVLTFIPMGRARQERYIDYRERKLSKKQEQSNKHITVTGLIFLFIGIVLNVVWYVKFYNV